MRFGGDYRRVHRDFLAGSNATGNFAFTGLFTEDAGAGPEHRLIASPIFSSACRSPPPSTLPRPRATCATTSTTPMPWTTGACCPRSRSTTASAGSSSRPTPKNTATWPMLPRIRTLGLPAGEVPRQRGSGDSRLPASLVFPVAQGLRSRAWGSHGACPRSRAPSCAPASA